MTGRKGRLGSSISSCHSVCTELSYNNYSHELITLGLDDHRRIWSWLDEGANTLPYDVKTLPYDVIVHHSCTTVGGHIAFYQQRCKKLNVKKSRWSLNTTRIDDNPALRAHPIDWNHFLFLRIAIFISLNMIDLICTPPPLAEEKYLNIEWNVIGRNCTEPLAVVRRWLDEFLQKKLIRAKLNYTQPNPKSKPKAKPEPKPRPNSTVRA